MTTSDRSSGHAVSLYTSESAVAPLRIATLHHRRMTPATPSRPRPSASALNEPCYADFIGGPATMASIRLEVRENAS